MKRLIYVDFENVSTAGLEGLQSLDEKDHVKIFLGPKCSKLSLIEADKVLHCNASVELITNDQIAKNALDFIIMVHLGYDIAGKKAKAYYIISQDKGYEPAIREMQSMTGETVERLVNISEVLKRDDVKGGFFSFFKKKKEVVENTTEHEVFSKGKSKKTTAGGKTSNGKNNISRGNERNNTNQNRNNGNKRNDSRNNENRNNENRNSENRNNRSNKPAKNNDVPKKNNGVTHTVSRSTSDPKPVSTVPQKPISKPSSAPKVLVDESKMDDLSVRDLVKAMGHETSVDASKTVTKSTKANNPAKHAEAKTQNVPNSKSTESKLAESKSVESKPAESKPVEVKQEAGKPNKPEAEKANKPAPLTAEEKALVDRLMKESATKEEFHNKLMGELRENDRATDIYKMKRSHFNQIARAREKEQATKETAPVSE